MSRPADRLRIAMQKSGRLSDPAQIGRAHV